MIAKCAAAYQLLFAVALIASSGVASEEGPTNRDDASYSFGFDTGDQGHHQRQESRAADGTVRGRYSYVDPYGQHRVVSYKADSGGYQAHEDVSPSTLAVIRQEPYPLPTALSFVSRLARPVVHSVPQVYEYVVPGLGRIPEPEDYVTASSGEYPRYTFYYPPIRSYYYAPSGFESRGTY